MGFSHYSLDLQDNICHSIFIYFIIWIFLHNIFLVHLYLRVPMRVRSQNVTINSYRLLRVVQQATGISTYYKLFF